MLKPIYRHHGPDSGRRLPAILLPQVPPAVRDALVRRRHRRLLSQADQVLVPRAERPLLELRR